MSQTEDLVLAYRILAAHGVVDAYGHVSVRSERDPHRYLLARAMAPELVTTDDICEFDLDSNVIRDPGAALYLERYIHGEIYKTRPEVMSVVHNHSPSVIPFGVTTVPLKPLFNILIAALGRKSADPGIGGALDHRRVADVIVEVIFRGPLFSVAGRIMD